LQSVRLYNTTARGCQGTHSILSCQATCDQVEAKHTTSGLVTFNERFAQTAVKRVKFMDKFAREIIALLDNTIPTSKGHITRYNFACNITAQYSILKRSYDDFSL
jgi:hypothetical protein